MSERERKELFGAVLGVLDVAPTTRGERSHVGSVVGELLEVGATPDEVKRRAGAWKRRRKTPITPQLLRYAWSEMLDLAGPEPEPYVWVRGWTFVYREPVDGFPAVMLRISPMFRERAPCLALAMEYAEREGYEVAEIDNELVQEGTYAFKSTNWIERWIVEQGLTVTKRGRLS